MHQARVGNNVINGVIASVLKRGVTLRAKNSIIGISGHTVQILLFDENNFCNLSSAAIVIVR